MSKKAELLTKYAAAAKLRRDQRVISSALVEVTPDDTSGRWPRWKRSTIEAALTAHSDRSQHYQRNGHRQHHGHGGTLSTLTAARAKQAEERGRLLELDRLEREGKLVDAEQVQRNIESDYHATKTYLLGIPASVVPELLMCIPSLSGEDRQQVSQALSEVLDRYIRHALSELRLGHHLPDEVAA
jgi:hypothetical protein